MVHDILALNLRQHQWDVLEYTSTCPGIVHNISSNGKIEIEKEEPEIEEEKL